MNRASKWALRVLAGAVMALSLTGPAPGNVGGCNAGSPPEADARAFCADRRFWECRRDQFAGRIDDAQFGSCLQRIETQCSGFVWPAGCSPTQGQAEGCVFLLANAELASIPTSELVTMYSDCNLCQ